MILLDSNSVCHAAKYTHNKLMFGDLYTGVVYGFFSMMMTFYKRFNDPMFCFAWDSSKSERRRILPTYKIKRKTREKTQHELEIDEVCYPQFKELRNVILPFIGWQNNFYQVGYEGDDVMMSVLLNNVFSVKPVMISDDQDMFQCLDHCSIYLRNKKILLTRDMFIEEYGITPRQWVEVKKIGGCSTDEVPGVSGVAEKTVIKYLRGELPRNTKKYKDIIANKDLAEFNEQLVKLPMEGTKKFQMCADRVSYHDLLEVFDEYGFHSFIKNKREWKRFVTDINSVDPIDDLQFDTHDEINLDNIPF